MKNVLCLMLLLLLGVSFSHIALAEGDAVKAPAADAVAAAPVVPAAVETVAKEELGEEELLDVEELDEESEDVKILREAAAKLKATDPALATKLEQLAEDFSW